jgi:hypothetical protein
MIKTIGETPIPRDSMTFFGFQKKLYLFGGFNLVKTFLKDLHSFNLTTLKWE